MTATKYALVPVVATDEMFWAAFEKGQDRGNGFFTRCDKVYAAMLAAAPKELPEEVVEKACDAYSQAYWERAVKTGACADESDHRAGIRAALLAVMGYK